MADPFANPPAARSVIGRHDGHSEHHLNCVVVRHGWTRNFSIPPEELEHLDYETLENILEVNTLKLRPVGVRIFVENPPDSGTWSKIRNWKDDGSLQSVLVKNFFSDRYRNGVLTRLEIRDGAGRLPEGDAMSLRSVGSKIFHPRDRSEAPKPPSKSRRKTIVSWFGLGKSSRSSNTPVPSTTEVPGEEQELVETPQKPSFFSLLRPQPQVQPTSVRRSIFDFFRTRQESRQPEDEGVQQQDEEELLRKRGWIPPGLVKRSRSLLGNGDSSIRNPFLGSSKSLSRRKKPSHDPFADEHTENGFGKHESTHELSEQEDEFLEIERPDSIAMESEMEPKGGKNWSRFRSKEKGKKKKGGKLGNGAEIVATPGDAFPNPPQQEDT